MNIKQAALVAALAQQARVQRELGMTCTPHAFLYTETPERLAMRTLLNAAGALGATVNVAFYKKDGDLRVMRCQPVAGADETKIYVTVADLDKSTPEETKFRRVCLDSVATVTVCQSAA